MEGATMLKKLLLACGVASSVLYVAVDWLAEIFHGGYHGFRDQAISR
jgi:hypothetical protein